MAILSLLALVVAGALPAGAYGHGEAAERYRTRVVEISPEGLPIDVRVKGDVIRFENRGDEPLVICGYDPDRCEEWIRIGPDSVFVDENSESYFQNQDGRERGRVPDDAGTRPDFKLVRTEPAAYGYHDHRVHWMGGDHVLPPNVDERDPEPQKVFDGRVDFRYGDTVGFVRTRLEYVGGRSWLQRYGEYALIGTGVAFMLAFFTVDARRRRGRPTGDEPPPPG